MEGMSPRLLIFVMLHGIACDERFQANQGVRKSIPENYENGHLEAMFSEYVKRQKHDLEQLRDVINAQRIKIADLEKENIAYKSILSRLEVRVASLESNGEHTEDKIDKNEHRTDAETTEHSKVANTKESNVEKPDLSHRIRRSSVENVVAFSASITVDQEHQGNGQDIAFDHVITNLGNGYNSHHGTFLAPVAGTYVFYFSLHSPGARADLVINGSPVAYLYIGNDQASQLAIVNLNVGDDVSVQNLQPDRLYWGSGYSTFSGFLLYEGMDSTQIVG